MNQLINHVKTFGYGGIINHQTTFTYNNEQRNVFVERIHVSRKGDLILTGKDTDKGNTYRSFSAEKIHNIVVVACPSPIGHRNWVK